MSTHPDRAHSPDVIRVAGLDLVEDIIGTYGFTRMIYLVLTQDREPPPGHLEMLDALLVTFTDHGATPSSMAARLTYLGAPEAMQSAVAAGLSGAGSRFLGTLSNSGAELGAAVARLPVAAASEVARAMVAEALAEGRRVTGLGHPEHKNGDPRVPKLLELAARHSLVGACTRTLLELPDAVFETTGRRLPVNAAGLAGALIADMGYSPSFARGIALISRAAGLVGQLLDEERAPVARAMWDRERTDPTHPSAGPEETP
jgi:citrate synthase